jgi:hypothetical protein
MPDMGGAPDVEPADDADGEPRQAKGKVVDAEVVDAEADEADEADAEVVDAETSDK